MNWKNFFSLGLARRSKPIVSKSPWVRSAGTVINTETSMQVAAYFRAVTYISTQISKLPWHLKDAKNNILSEDRLNKLISLKPNKEMNSMRFRMTLTSWAMNYGNGWAEIERDLLGRPIALWPLHPKRVLPERTSNGDLYFIVYETNGYGGKPTYLLPEDMFHIPNVYTLDGIVGQSTIAYASESLGIARGADIFANSLFANGGLPAGVLTAPNTLSDDAFHRLKDDWKKNYGKRNTGDTAILEEGLKYESIAHDPEVMQFLESRKFSVVEIARFTGVSPTKLFDTASATYNNIEQANLEVATDTLDTWARIWEMEADIKLLNNAHSGRKTEMDLYAVFRGDMKTRAEYFTKLMQSAAMTPNQIREKEGYSPYEGGDRYYIASNNFSPVDRMDDIVDSQVNKNGASTAILAKIKDNKRV